MKNNYLAIIFILSLSALNAQQLTAKVDYKVRVAKEFSLTKDNKKTDTNALKNSMTLLENSVKKNVGYLDYLLIFNKDEAEYKNVPILEDSNNPGLKYAKIFTGSLNSYYYNSLKNEIVRQAVAYGQLFLISSKLNARKWILTQDSKTIGSYLCYKATSTLVTKNSVGTFYKPVIAWYAPKLPVPYGPKGYGGLPGLILQLTEGDFTFYVSKLTLNPKKQVVIKKPTKGKQVSEAEFLAIGLQTTSHFGKFKN